MKYVFINLKNFMIKEKWLFVLTIMVIVVTSLMIHFAYGIYQHFHVVIENNKDVATEMNITFSEKNGDVATKDRLDKCLGKIAKRMDDIEVTGNHITIITMRTELNNICYDVRVNIDENGIKAPKSLFKNIKALGELDDGVFWNDTDEKNGTPVAIAYSEEYYYEEFPLDSVIMLDNGNMLIDEKEYEIIGYQHFTGGEAMIPYNSLNDDVEFELCLILFDEMLTTYTYDLICDIFKEEFGDIVSIGDLPTLDRDSYYTYKTVGLLVVLLAVVASLNFMILYMYIMDKRKNRMSIYRMCGMTKHKVNFINFIECMLICIVTYVVSVTTYAMIFVPNLQRYFVYMKGAYSLKVYIAIGLLYFVILVVVCSILIVVKNRNILKNYKSI